MQLESFKYPEKVDRPKTRADCKDTPRPCPFAGCVYNLYLDVNEDTGSIKLNFPKNEPGEVGPSCVLDVAAAGGLTLEEVAENMNLTRERVRQLEELAMEHIRKNATPEMIEVAKT